MNRKNFIFSKDTEISFFDNIFYWLWTYVPKGGFPERSSGIICITQYAYFMFFISLILSVINNKMIVALYEMDERITIGPIVLVFIFLLCVDLKIYTWEKYLILKDKYVRMNEKQKKKLKKTFFIYLTVSILVAIVAIKLWVNYAETVQSIVGTKKLIYE